jgi:hypothetical protein
MGRFCSVGSWWGGPTLGTSAIGIRYERFEREDTIRHRFKLGEASDSSHGVKGKTSRSQTYVQ